MTHNLTNFRDVLFKKQIERINNQLRVEEDELTEGKLDGATASNDTVGPKHSLDDAHGVEGRIDVVRRNVGAHDLEVEGLNIGVAHAATDGVKDLADGIGPDRAFLDILSDIFAPKHVVPDAIAGAVKRQSMEEHDDYEKHGRRNSSTAVVVNASLLAQRRLKVLTDETLYTVRVVDGRLKLERVTDVWVIAPGGGRLAEV